MSGVKSGVVHVVCIECAWSVCVCVCVCVCFGGKSTILFLICLFDSYVFVVTTFQTKKIMQLNKMKGKAWQPPAELASLGTNSPQRICVPQQGNS